MNRDIQNTLKQGLAHFQSGRLVQAESMFNAVLSADPRNIDAMQLLGITLPQMGRPLEGEKLLRKAIRRNGKIARLHYNLGLVLEVQGKLKEAVMAFREAIKLEPKDEWPRVNLGVVYGKLNRLEEGIDCCRKVLKINPNNVAAQANLGQFLWRKGDNSGAKQVLQQALQLQPDMIQALANLGAVLFSERELEQAEELLRKAVALGGRDQEILGNLAGVLLAKGDGSESEAIDLCREVVKSNPNSPDAQFNLGRALEYTEQWNDAMAAYSRGLELHPGFTEAMIGLAQADMVMGRFDDARELCFKVLKTQPESLKAYSLLLNLEGPEWIQRNLEKIEELYREKGKSEGDKRKLAFALAKYSEKQGQYDKAFHHLEDGNRLRRTTFDYATKIDQTFFNAIKEVFSSEFFQQREDYGSSDKTPIFILGMPRSGTTLTEQILASHSQVFGAGELPFVQQMLIERCKPAPIQQFPDITAAMERDGFDSMASQYLDLIKTRAGESPRVTDKMPHNFVNLGVIRLMFPQAKIIHCQRNPIDNCLSIFKQDFTSLHKYAYDLKELGSYYLLYNDLMQHWRNTLPSGYMLDLVYEDLVADQEGMTKRLLEFCDLPWEDGCLKFHTTERAVKTASQAQVRRKIYTDSVKLWQRYEQQLQPMIQILQDGGVI